MFQKHAYVRSPKLMKLVRNLPCQNCGTEDGTVCGAHTNWGGGKGRSIKADDNLIAALCHRCHSMIDQGSMPKAERQSIWQAAHEKTVSLLLNRGEWPANVPMP